MLSNWYENPVVLSRSRKFAYAVSDILLMIIYGSLMILVYTTIAETLQVSLAQTPRVFDLKIALLFSLSFILLSGFWISVILVNLLTIRFIRRVLYLVVLLIGHTVIFYLAFGTSYSVYDLSLVSLGVLTVAAAETTNEFVRRVTGTGLR